MDYLLIALSLFLSAFYSGSETALVSVSRLKFEALRRLDVPGAELVVDMMRQPDRFLTTCVVGNNVAIVAWSSLVAMKLEPYLSGVAIVTLSTALMFLFGEVLPKTLGRSLANRVAISFVRWIRYSELVFYPLTILLRAIGRVAARLAGASSGGLKIGVTRKDLEFLLVSGEKSGPIERQERAFITRVFRLGHQRVRDVMVPRTEIRAVRIDEKFHRVRQKFEETGFSRLLVYGEDLDDVKGFVHVLDLFHEPKRWQDVIRPVLAVPESVSTVEVLRRMQAERVSMAVVVDEYGGTEGLVTIEDLVEQLFGEIHDEFDYDERLVRRLGENSFIVRGRAEIAYLNDTFGLGLPVGDYATLSGLLNELAGHIPKPGEEFEIGRWRARVLSTSKKRIEWVRLDSVDSGAGQDHGVASE